MCVCVYSMCFMSMYGFAGVPGHFFRWRHGKSRRFASYHAKPEPYFDNWPLSLS